MPKTTTVQARVNPEVKAGAENVLSYLGLTTSQAIDLFLRQVIHQQGLPFEVKIPNEVTRRAIEEAIQDGNIKRFKNTKALMADLESDEDDSAPVSSNEISS